MQGSRCIAALAPLLFSSGTAHAQAPFALHNGDRVAWYGDSITDNSAYCLFAELYTVLHFPHLNVRFYNAGMSGDRVVGGGLGPVDQRLTRDVFSRKPTVITSMLGMNDAGYSKFNDGNFDVYKKGYQHMVDRFHKEAPGARVYLFRPSPFDEIAHPNERDFSYNGVLLQYADYVSSLAQANGYGVVDENKGVNDMLTRAVKIDPTNAAHLINDKVHPGWQGDYTMAQTVLKAWNAPAIVSDVTVEAGTGHSTATNSKVWDVHPGTSVAWTERDESLPFPYERKDALAKLVAESSDFDQDLNQENLKVSGLASGTYHLKIDGKAVSEFTADQLSAGVNLALYNTPMIEQSQKVLGLTQRRCELFYQRWREYDVTLQGFPSSKLENAKRAIDAEVEDLVGLQHAAALPVDHHYELTPAWR